MMNPNRLTALISLLRRRLGGPPARTDGVEFDEIPPIERRFVRSTLTGWPHSVVVPLGVIEFTVFGATVEPTRP